MSNPEDTTMTIETTENVKAQCMRCSYTGERKVIEDDGTISNPATEDECPRCGAHQVLGGSIEREADAE